MKRRHALTWALATIALGLASRRFPLAGAWPGDVLYAVMIHWGLRFLFPRSPVAPVAAAAFGVCAIIEASQLLQVPFLVAARAHPLGAVVLGRGFLWEDLLAYGLGAALALAIERAMGYKASSTAPPPPERSST